MARPRVYHSSTASLHESGAPSGALIILLKDTLRWCLVIVPSRFLPKIEERHSLALASELSFHLSYIFAALLFASSGVILIKC